MNIKQTFLTDKINGQIGTALQVIIIAFVLSLAFLLKDNVGHVNEVDILPLARQFSNPEWIPNDWYLNQPAGYRLLFQIVFGKLADLLGFLATSIIGRIVCYFLFSTGFVFLGKQLGLNLFLMLAALFLFIYIAPSKGIDFYNYKNQGLVTYEWMVGALEAKAIAYGLVLLGIGWMLKRRFKSMALSFGLATSFHVLVGGWSFLSALILSILNRQIKGIRYVATVISLYLALSVFAVPTVMQHFLSKPQSSEIEASYIYVFLRLPHHLNPLSWRSNWQRIYLLYLVILVISIAILWWKNKKSKRNKATYDARLTFGKFVLVTLAPFLIGVILAPFDKHGKLLQYYPFRLVDVMLPLGAYLLFVSVLKCILNTKLGRAMALICSVLMGWIFMIQAGDFKGEISKIQRFPGKSQGVTDRWKEICYWIKDNTPKDSIIISHPVKFPNFSWMSERATIVKYKLLPQNKKAILSWYERLDDLSGGMHSWHVNSDNKSNSKIKKSIAKGYNNLSTQQVEDLMNKYQAEYFLTNASHKLDLPIAYQNSEHILYSFPTVLEKIDEQI